MAAIKREIKMLEAELAAAEQEFQEVQDKLTVV